MAYKDEEYKGIKLKFGHDRTVFYKEEDRNTVVVKTIPKLTDRRFIAFGHNKERAFEKARWEIDRIADQIEYQKAVKKLRFKKKKLFYYKIVKETPRRMGGCNTTVEVYKHTPKGMEDVGQVYYCTASYKGEESEVLTLLNKEKEIPDAMYKAMKGYYGWSKGEDFNFKIERL